MRFLVLDSLRGISAILIILFHIENIGVIHSGHLHGIAIIDHCFLLVDFFFVLSGFVIAYSYFAKVREARDVSKFMIRRFGRIYPLHFLMLLAFVALELTKVYVVKFGHLNHLPEHAPFTQGYGLPMLVSSFLLLQSFTNDQLGSWNSPSWSISVEFYTYMVFAVLLVLSRNKPRVMALLSVATAAISCVILALYSPFYMDTIHDYALIRCFYGFFCGVLAQFIYHFVPPLFKSGVWRDSCMELAICAFIVGYMQVTGIEPASLAAPVIYIPFVLVFARQGGLISRVLMAKPFERVGHASYTIYITHAFIILLCAKIMRFMMDRGMLNLHEVLQTDIYGETLKLLTTGNAYFQDIVVLLILLAILAISYVLRHRVEEPCRIYFYKLSNQIHP